MNFTNFILNREQSHTGDAVALFRCVASDMLSVEKENTFASIYSYKDSFSLHIIVDGLFENEQAFDLVLEKIFLIIGRENYNIILKRKLVFVSFKPEYSATASKLIFRLRSFITNIYIATVRLDDTGNFSSSVNICVESDEMKMLHHFRNYLSRLITKQLLFDFNANYYMISENPVNLSIFNEILIQQVTHTPDLLMLFKDSALELSSYRESLDVEKKENLVLLNAVSFLKKEVKNQFAERKGDQLSVAREQDLAMQRINSRIENIRLKYSLEYESLPVVYKKMGAFLKLLLGKREYSYYLSKKQKRSFVELLELLPKDKQLEMWYYYEYEILPAWYKKLGKILSKKK